MPRRQRTPPPAGPYVGDEGELPPWWPSRPPVSDHKFLNQGGFTYVGMYGNAGIARVEHLSIYFGTAPEVEDYQEGAPGGMTGAVAYTYSCIWRRVRIDTKPPKPRAKRKWEELAESTRSGYRGRMRHMLGLTTEAQFKHYYETAVDLSFLRRHQTKTVVAEGLGRISFPRQGDLDPPPWLITWRKS